MTQMLGFDTPSIMTSLIDTITDKLIEQGRKSASGHFLVLDHYHVRRIVEELVNERVNELESFARDVRDGFDCDTGHNGHHPDYCRTCYAARLLPPTN